MANISTEHFECKLSHTEAGSFQIKAVILFDRTERITKRLMRILRSCLTLFLAAILFGGCSEKIAPFSTNKEPVQEEYTGSEVFEQKLTKGRAMIIPVATYRIGAVVMSKKEYNHGWGAEIAPFDLALVWGYLSHEKIKKLLSIKHDSTRLAWFRIKGDDPPVTPEYVMSHGSNNHLIPANETIRTALDKHVGVNDKVLIEGYLVNVEAEYDGQPITMKTSLSRTDQDRGACEIIYVTSVQVWDKTYR
jgi:hypothetical protein